MINCDYVTGTELHYKVMSSSEHIMKLCPTINSAKPLNDLKSIQDSC